MADTSVQLKIESWIVENELPGCFPQLSFTKRKLPLVWGGEFEFDAVDDKRHIAACISTGSRWTSGGKSAVGKITKIKADTLYLLNAKDVETRMLVFTDKEMCDYFNKEQQKGRFPSENELKLRFVDLPEKLASSLRVAQKKASDEVAPRKQ